VLDAWAGPAAAPIADGEVALDPASAFLLYWIAAFAADSSPRYELRVTPNGAWSPSASTPECAVLARGDGSVAIGPPPNTGGWFTWWSARQAAERLAGLPEGSQIHLAIAADPRDDGGDPAIGRVLYRGVVRDGAWQISETVPALARDTLAAALAFAHEILSGWIPVRSAEERRALDAAATVFAGAPEELAWQGEKVRPIDGEERMFWILATPVFRTRFAAHWPCDPTEADAEDDE
jgi:hypothetical protein